MAVLQTTLTSLKTEIARREAADAQARIRTETNEAEFEALHAELETRGTALVYAAFRAEEVLADLDVARHADRRPGIKAAEQELAGRTQTAHSTLADLEAVRDELAERTAALAEAEAAPRP